MRIKNRLYFSFTILVTVLLSVLHTAALLTAYNTDVGYLDRTPLVVILRILYVCGAAWCFTVPFLLSKETPFSPMSTTPHIPFSYLAAILLVLSGVSLFIESPNVTGIASVLVPILGLLAPLASAFFFAKAKNAKKASTLHAIFGFLVLGFLVLGFLLCLLFYIYFDMYVTINSPLKTALQLSVLSALFFILCHIRSAIGKPLPRIASASRLVCALFCVPTAVSHLAFGASKLCGTLERTVISPALTLPLLSLGIFALSEMIFYKD